MLCARGCQKQRTRGSAFAGTGRRGVWGVRGALHRGGGWGARFRVLGGRARLAEGVHVEGSLAADVHGDGQAQAGTLDLQLPCLQEGSGMGSMPRQRAAGTPANQVSATWQLQHVCWGERRYQHGAEGGGSFGRVGLGGGGFPWRPGAGRGLMGASGACWGWRDWREVCQAEGWWEEAFGDQLLCRALAGAEAGGEGSHLWGPSLLGLENRTEALLWMPALGQGARAGGQAPERTPPHPRTPAAPLSHSACLPMPLASASS